MSTGYHARDMLKQFTGSGRERCQGPSAPRAGRAKHALQKLACSSHSRAGVHVCSSSLQLCFKVELTRESCRISLPAGRPPPPKRQRTKRLGKELHGCTGTSVMACSSCAASSYITRRRGAPVAGQTLCCSRMCSVSQATRGAFLVYKLCP